MTSSFVTPKARTCNLPLLGRGTFATDAIAAGETVAAFGGRCITRTQLDQLGDDQQRRSIQIDEQLYLAGGLDLEAADLINHSCEPNCGLRGNTVLVAMRDIAVGEEITYDYSMSDGSHYDEFECACGTPSCRGKVTGHDWMLPELQLRYRGWFSPYLALRIATLASPSVSRRAFSY